MKNRLFISIIIAGSVAMTSCQKFLDQQPKSSYTQEEVFSNLDNVEPTIAGLYTSWRNIHKDRGGFMFQVGGDEAQQSIIQVGDPDQGALDKYTTQPSNNALTQQWDSRWPTVSTAAQAIYGLQTSTTPDTARRNSLLASACFIRAAVYFELAAYWGALPIIDQAHQTELGMGRQPIDKVYEYIINDLVFASTHLPETVTDKSKVTKYVALALLGKVYMFAPVESNHRDFQKAADAFNAVITSGKYNLVTNYADLWDPSKPNSNESLYEFQFINTYPDNNQIQWQMGSRVMADIDGYCYFGGYDLMMPTKYAYSDVADGGVWESGDLRKNESIRYDFTYKGVPHTSIPAGFYGGDELDPHVKKFEDPRTDGKLSFWYSGKNVIYIRYSDVLLSYAECLNELGQTSNAVAAVKQVRARAFGGTVPPALDWSAGMSQTDFRTKILDERMRELCFEGWRRQDVVRTGNFVTYIKARNKWAAQSGQIQDYHKLYPIPLTEILQNPEIPSSAQNPGYTQ
ncbi:RagB/SusD family nutrient uptake outer membrane protein [Pinibacter aurantiacus]|uniref:RagB/SusD family nutrient uptake outer membrane protein n=1 Tax=Pinibacter aurantiacus TaxID=2851599 RepID=A0A9E2SF81_9BACT|nr:RagB/SusD family nutrient uptake outer membrane protein [Pinibacter aurantiacus]MBV4360089.1 RagB/SusD family nutrient uptake outer membrane protein [Pinibacter aurantiacus]